MKNEIQISVADLTRLPVAGAATKGFLLPAQAGLRN